MKTSQSGFSLMELLVSITILGILLSVAVPSYLSYMEQARRADAIAALLDLQSEQERFRTNCVQYAASLGNSDTCNAGGGSFVLGQSSTSPEGHYNLAITASSAAGFTATATPVNGGAQAGDSCGTFAITQGGPSFGANQADASCWSL